MKIIVIGHGMVGHKFLESLSEYGASNLDVTVLCEEPRGAYDRVHLSEFFSGKTAEDLSLVAPDFFERSGIALKLNAKAQSIDTVAKTVSFTVHGVSQTLSYDKLVMATGSYPFVPTLAGNQRRDCFVYRTIEDLEAMQECGSRSRTGVVIGGGLLGLECAKALRDMGLETHVVEFAPRLMAVQMDESGGRVLRQKIEALGVTAHTQKNTLEIVDGNSATHRMRFEDGSHLETDMIVFSAGIRPRDELARDNGLAVGPRGGIVIDNRCRTSDPAVYAIGECALWDGKIYGLVAPGYEMARVAAAQIVSDSTAVEAVAEVAALPEFNGADMSTKLKLMGVDVASLGDPHGSVLGSRAYQFTDERKQVYKKIVVSECGKYLLGAVMVGDATEYGNLLQMMLNRIELPAAPEFLILPQADGSAKPAFGVEALPDTAQICSCNNVNKGALCAAVGNGATNIASLKSCTKAGTACGGCVPLVTQIMKAEMKKQGLAVNNHICEHFACSRQELYHFVRVGQIKDFSTLLAQHGKGLGCDICKPLAANILASCWNEFVLKKEHASLQDSNDYFLGNIQKDGTYSVVPRMAGGEVTADGLIAVGQVAKKYALYTKITGGQRVDLFGARLEQLPLIWEELIAAGFESGHAYGKSLRTVKSCVGSTWCRYGVDDSMGLAIALENRYKGLRSPHKIKFGVSGCTRECAEAQSKDVGIIATEKGWNLYVCGNGGMKPRHAELLAADLDKTTLVRYIDRFLMFYVRTADRLQRTSVWRDNLEGGLDYLKQVVVEDKLLLADELEAQMQQVVDTYECEWKKAVNDPATRQRFRHFVNSDQADQNVVFMQERGQIRPASLQERGVIPIAELVE
ncbi:MULTISPECIES: nitrite reductase large subunit NirB [unclassified Undibacterium]|uniref:nitrite reductase large subunit NirB n=1 Tax=unclassified Undibacterium TaxID=2630295 RepID=UPI002AC9C94A|nr:MULTISPECIES: nitrite reductase large subunit NirB [unclassified Undibacterium]MEB0138507.1 nitrite reductase large subunit NirB [Undibacterium sp. CCC2.1]MEB0173092.1 nitrite reductase large subunit NirB [Undibacterium sp. CCC1.1]MEB0176144.1 nitrite reductase large subunit NirB [Undibacterium sp. CCC3.4]MEB0215410.1 nitrite reductase large subunit NirB [Undibacterium sp. 5I2]WPX42751.1 nitrite reductase large subunit NirB [Undibacterium sp. CCC3.4]